MRQHVNPLSAFFLDPKDIPEINQLFNNENLLFHVDIGCARGNFLLKMASQFPHINFLGLEIREKLVILAEKDRIKLKLHNLKFMFINASVNLENILLIQLLVEKLNHFIQIMIYQKRL